MREDLLKQYAEFAVKVGVNPQKGQTMLISCSVESAPFARLCAQAAFEAGARDVVMKYTDEQIARIRMENASVETLEDVKPYILRSYLDYAESEGGACILNIHDSDPEAFKGLDAQKIARANKARREALAAWRDYTMKDKVQWSIVAIPGPAWAKKVFPGDENAEEKLWQAIFQVCRVQEGTDVTAAWREHLAKLEARRNRLNELQLESVHFESANGTNLTVGLAENHTWEAAGGRTPQGYEFLPNIPTEEVFTAPTKTRWTASCTAQSPMCTTAKLLTASGCALSTAAWWNITQKRTRRCWAICWIQTRVRAALARLRWCLPPAPSTKAAFCSTARCLTKTPPATLLSAPGTPAR